jgi:hypothetical protein
MDTTLVIGYITLLGRFRDFHPVEHAPAGHTIKKPFIIKGFGLVGLTGFEPATS